MNYKIAIIILASTVSAIFAAMLIFQRVKNQKSYMLLRKMQLQRLDSIRILASGIIERQIELSEAVIRIVILLPYLDLEKNKEFDVFFNCHKEIKHFATQKAREKLSTEERSKQDKERKEIEEKYRIQIVESAKKALDIVKSLAH